MPIAKSLFRQTTIGGCHESYLQGRQSPASASHVSCSVLFVLIGCTATLALPFNDEEVGPRADSSYPLSLTLIWYDAYNLLPHRFKTMSEEVQRIYDDFGVAVRWQRGRMDESDVEAARDPLKLNVMLHPGSASGWGLKDNVMGVATHREGAKGSVYIFFPEVVSALGSDRSAGCARRPQAMHELARALGRVVAHEVVHVLAPTRPHTTNGLMKRRLGRRLLLQRSVHMDGKSARMVREEIQARQPRVTVASATRSGAPSPDQLSWLGTQAQSWPPLLPQ